ncbi:hypothetical protein PMAYCL1PPCAC_12206 [Pristionchus mayeri]|uniref:Tyrosine-protein kinase n=1 Tax=Pristionchus mayeri TaxID=1317129 RepID=A0AAN4ZN57_9BILA|nr:hypothetical protein PMAYCL1PPCAC_12206 [Pristionchus mayeri]
MNAPGTKSDPKSIPPEEVVRALFKPKTEGEEGKAKLDKLLELFPDTAEEERPSTLVLQKVAAIETGAVLPLKSENFFHFFLMEHEVWEKVRNPGEFLVRQLPLDEKDNDDDEEEYVICVMGKNKPLNIPIIFSSARNFCYINGYSFDTPAGLVQYHYRNHIPLDENGTRLLTPIMKDSIFINHAQIAFTNKVVVGSRGIAIASIRTGFFSNVQVAVMDYSTFAFEQGRLENLYQVTRLARSCDHPNIIKYYGIAMSQAPAYILTEYCSQGTLGYIVRKPVGPDVGKREMYAHGLAKGLKYLEHRMILHRNIHIDNIYVDGKNQVKIAEFANSIFGVKLIEILGMVAMRHLAPEVIMRNHYSKKSEIWAFGVVLWEIFHNGATPYDEFTDTEVAKKVAYADLRLKCISDKFPNKLWRICEKCWAKQGDERPSIDEILEEMEMEQRASSGIFDRIYESFALLME